MKLPKIAFIKTPVPLLQDDALEPDMGALYCATYVKCHCAVDVVYVDLSLDSLESIWETIKACRVFCFSTFTANYHLTKEICKTIKKLSPLSITIAGGHHATALPQIVAQDFDYVVVGEGEIAEADLINNIISGNIPSEHIVTGTCLTNLDDAGWIDYSLVQMERYTRRVNGEKSISILTSRGCPYNCNFCNSALMKMYKTVRFRSAEDVVKEILFLNSTYDITSFRIQDDIFSINRQRLKKIADMLEPYQFSFRCFARIDNIDEDILNDYRRMGVFHLSFGIESGSQKILDLMNKGIQVEDIRKNMKLAKQSGMKCRVYLIAGYPGETFETLDETIQLIKDIKPDDISIYPLLPYPGTPLFKEPEKFGITYIDEDFSKYYQIYGDKQSGYVFETETISRAKLKKMRDYLIEGIADVCPWAIDDEENR